MMKLCALITMNLPVLIIGVLLWLKDYSYYGQIIANETSDWNRAPIVDIVKAGVLPCPSGYEVVEGVFYGTRNYC